MAFTIEPNIELAPTPAAPPIAAAGPSLPVDVGALLQGFRHYLLAIANAELPSELAGAVAPSDLVQETLLRGLDRFAGFRGTGTEELAAWLRQILHNQMASARRAQLRRKRRETAAERIVPVVDAASQSSPSDAAMSHEERERLNDAMARLPDDQRQALELRHREDLTFQEIGRRMSRSDEAARKLWVRAVMRLQQELGIDVDERGAIRNGHS